MPGVGETREGVDEFACWPAQANEYFQTGLYKVTTPVVVKAAAAGTYPVLKTADATLGTENDPITTPYL